MELDFLSFTIGMVAGGGFFGFGLAVGALMNRDIFTRQVKDEEFDPKAEVQDEQFFEESWTGEGEFPSDEVLEQLDQLHRHSTY
jgi:hypothetical protein